MAEISVNIVMDAITLALKDAYPACDVYDSRVPQEFTPGAFFVRQLSTPRTQRSGLVYVGENETARSAGHRRAPIYEITYFPAAEMEDDQAEECRRVEEDLYDLLELIVTPTGDLLSGRNIEGSTPDGVLVMTVTYPYGVVYNEQAAPMEELKGSLMGLPYITDEEENHGDE